MRQQYHSRTTTEGNDVWDVHKLVKLSKDLLVFSIPLSSIKELDKEHWYTSDASEKPTCRNISQHCRLINEANLEHPIILCADGLVMDGMHRICKALIEGHQSINAVRFEKTPEPDFKNVILSDLPYNDEQPKASKPEKLKVVFLLILAAIIVVSGLIGTTNIFQQQEPITKTISSTYATKVESKKTNSVIQSFNLFTNKPVEIGKIDPILSEERTEHILRGNEKNGGHLYGIGRPCKSEFPSSWDENKIINTIKEVAANDNLPWEQQKNGYYIADSRKDGVRLRVVLNEDRTQIITGYPTNMPRNPCVKPPANDNTKNDNTKPEQAPIELD